MKPIELINIWGESVFNEKTGVAEVNDQGNARVGRYFLIAETFTSLRVVRCFLSEACKIEPTTSIISDKPMPIIDRLYFPVRGENYGLNLIGGTEQIKFKLGDFAYFEVADKENNK